ncbi:MAG TPA: glycosyltransferase family 2 protein [Candidatus Eisenbergiella merdipullorum]|uniref:Glycosyltransferase family 2 protein n=1 Tax=Candidatus Eisenbergiella merdipullorum TaxID=2838553 RepID=A0A9D2I5T2_9FIRM|nr:glycosyltransferase family 2 protein [Candidatus Eisenbergiella merdipullorum]
MEEKEKVLLIIPAYNEAANIQRVVDNLIQDFPQYDYVVVNDGSSDGTGGLCMEKGYQVLNLPINLGIGGAVQTGYRYALKYGYDIAVQLDGDGQHDASYVKRLIEPLLSGEADVVIGSRFLRREGFQSSRSRRVGINILSDLIWLCTGKRIRDVTSGFRAVNRRFISIYAEDYPSDYPEPEAIITAVMHRGRVAEVPVVMKEREGGTSSITFRKSVYYMIKVTLAILVKRISYGIRR